MWTQVTDWAGAHPLIVIGVATAVLNWVAKPRTPEEYAAMPKWLAEGLRLTSAVGIDPVKVIAIVKGWVTK